MSEITEKMSELNLGKINDRSKLDLNLGLSYCKVVPVA